MRLRKPSPSMYVSIAALVVAMGGTSYAAVQISGSDIKNKSITSKDIKRNSLGSGVITNGSIARKDLKDNVLPTIPEPEADRWVYVNPAGNIAAQSGGFTLVAGYPSLPNTAPANMPDNSLRANGNVYINANEELGDNAIIATLTLQNTVDVDGGGMAGRTPGSDAKRSSPARSPSAAAPSRAAPGSAPTAPRPARRTRPASWSAPATATAASPPGSTARASTSSSRATPPSCPTDPSPPAADRDAPGPTARGVAVARPPSGSRDRVRLTGAVGDYLLLGVRHRPAVEPEHHGYLSTRRLGVGDAGALAGDVKAALADSAWRGVGRGRDSLVLRIWDGRAVHRLIEGAGQVPQEGPVPHLFRCVWRLADPALGHRLSAAQALAELCDLIAAVPGTSPDAFAERLGDQAAGIRAGRAGWVDLLRAGRNRLPGDGFRPEYEDGSHRQVRHFAGTVAAAERLGTRASRAAGILRGDRPGSADGRLSAQAVAFAADLRAGRLAPAEAGDWVRAHLLTP